MLWDLVEDKFNLNEISDKLYDGSIGPKYYFNELMKRIVKSDLYVRAMAMGLDSVVCSTNQDFFDKTGVYAIELNYKNMFLTFIGTTDMFSCPGLYHILNCYDLTICQFKVTELGKYEDLSLPVDFYDRFNYGYEYSTTEPLFVIDWDILLRKGIEVEDEVIHFVVNWKSFNSNLYSYYILDYLLSFSDRYPSFHLEELTVYSETIKILKQLYSKDYKDMFYGLRKVFNKIKIFVLIRDVDDEFLSYFIDYFKDFEVIYEEKKKKNI